MPSSTPLPAPLGSASTRFALWLISGALASYCMAWLSLAVQRAGFAPVAILSLVVGGVLGWMLASLANVLLVRSVPLLAAGAVRLALIAASAQRGIAYIQFRTAREAQLANNPHAAMFAAENSRLGGSGFWEFMRNEAGRSGMLIWAIDGALIVIAASGVVVWRARRVPPSTTESTGP